MFVCFAGNHLSSADLPGEAAALPAASAEAVPNGPGLAEGDAACGTVNGEAVAGGGRLLLGGAGALLSLADGFAGLYSALTFMPGGSGNRAGPEGGEGTVTFRTPGMAGAAPARVVRTGGIGGGPASRGAAAVVLDRDPEPQPQPEPELPATETVAPLFDPQPQPELLATVPAAPPLEPQPQPDFPATEPAAAPSEPQQPPPQP